MLTILQHRLEQEKLDISIFKLFYQHKPKAALIQGLIRRVNYAKPLNLVFLDRKNDAN
jgi:hypothetical protein